MSLALIKERWRTGNLVGDQQHVLRVRVRQGYMFHLYQPGIGLEGQPIIIPLIWKGVNHDPWQGQWIVTGDWIDVPNVVSADWTRSFADKGTSSLTVVAENVDYPDVTGPGGLYHTIRRGWFSPMRGVQVASRPSLWASNDWKDVYNGAYQIELWEGYGEGAEVEPGGDAVERTWVGIVEDCEMESSPDRITLTCRDYMIMLTDQRAMGWNKAREIRSPITFADRQRTQGQTRVMGSPHVSSGSFTVDEHSGVSWQSAPQSTPTDVQWVEITLPEGYYTNFFLAPEYDGMEMWMSIKVAHLPGLDHGRMDETVPIPEGWLDLSSGATVPGTSDVTYVRHIPSVTKSPPRLWGFGHGFDLGDGSLLRLSFRNLHHDTDPSPGDYAGTVSFFANRFGSNPNLPPPFGSDVNAYHWILVNDAADVVRMVLIWAGFKEFYVEDFGWSLVNPLHFGETVFFMDIIDEILAQGNVTFYMQSPTREDMSIGVPHFEHQTALDAPYPGMVEVRDTDMLEAADVKWDNSALPYVLRYRGDIAKASQGGQALFQDRVLRYMSIYYPPWSGVEYKRLGQPATTGITGDQRVAGVRRHFTETLGVTSTIGLQSNDECLFACVLAALQFALAAVTASFQIAGLPGFELNQQISLVDEGTGLNSRLWVASIESKHTVGQGGLWTMTIGGSLLDTEDMAALERDYDTAYSLYLNHKPPSQIGQVARPPRFGA